MRVRGLRVVCPEAEAATDANLPVLLMSLIVLPRLRDMVIIDVISALMSNDMAAGDASYVVRTHDNNFHSSAPLQRQHNGAESHPGPRMSQTQ